MRADAHKTPRQLVSGRFGKTADSALSQLPPVVCERLAGYAPNTQRALKADWRVWCRWCVDPAKHPGRRSRKAWPISPKGLVEFIKAHSPPIIQRLDGTKVLDMSVRTENERAAATLSRYLSSLRVLHHLAGYSDDPTKDADVQSTRRLVMRGRRGSTPKRPLRLKLILRVLRKKAENSWQIRDRALLAVAYCGMMRRSEVVGIEVEDISWDVSDGSATITIRRSKTDQAGIGRVCYLERFAVQALRRWLKAACITSGPVFRRVLPKGRVGHAALLGKEVARIVKRALRRIGISEEQAREFAGHSPRIGAAHDLAIDGNDIAAIMVAGGWTSPAMVALYTREIRAKENAMAQMLARKSRNPRSKARLPREQRGPIARHQISSRL